MQKGHRVPAGQAKEVDPEEAAQEPHRKCFGLAAAQGPAFVSTNVMIFFNWMIVDK
jgi:hypothetical protein